MGAAQEYGLEKTPLLHVNNKSEWEGEVVLSLCWPLVVDGESSTCAVTVIRWRGTSWAQAQIWMQLPQNAEKMYLIAASVEGQGRELNPHSLWLRHSPLQFQSCVALATLFPPAQTPSRLALQLFESNQCRPSLKKGGWSAHFGKTVLNAFSLKRDPRKKSHGCRLSCSCSHSSLGFHQVRTGCHWCPGQAWKNMLKHVTPFI